MSIIPQHSFFLLHTTLPFEMSISEVQSLKLQICITAYNTGWMGKSLTFSCCRTAAFTR